MFVPVSQTFPENVNYVAASGNQGQYARIHQRAPSISGSDVRQETEKSIEIERKKLSINRALIMVVFLHFAFMQNLTKAGLAPILR